MSRGVLYKRINYPCKMSADRHNRYILTYKYQTYIQCDAIRLKLCLWMLDVLYRDEDSILDQKIEDSS